MTEKQVRELLRKACYEAGSQRAWADKAKVSHALVSLVLAGRREPRGRLLAALKVGRAVSYWRIRDE